MLYEFIAKLLIRMVTQIPKSTENIPLSEKSVSCLLLLPGIIPVTDNRDSGYRSLKRTSLLVRDI